MYGLWNGALERSGDFCRFDVTPGDGHVGRGTDAFVHSCLAAYGVSSGVRSWKVRPICSPHFASDRAAGDFRARFPMAWEFVVELQAPVPGLHELPEQRKEVDAFDATYSFQSGESQWSTRAVVVIGRLWRDDGTAVVLERLAADAELAPLTATHLQVGPEHHVRLDLGERTFPGAEAEVTRVMAAVRRVGLAVHWNETVDPRWRRRGPRS